MHSIATLIAPITTKKKTKFGKFYLPGMLSFGRTRDFRRICRTQTEAKSYAQRAVKHFEGMFCHNGN